jgi:hypothetical protein
VDVEEVVDVDDVEDEVEWDDRGGVEFRTGGTADDETV